MIFLKTDDEIDRYYENGFDEFHLYYEGKKTAWLHSEDEFTSPRLIKMWEAWQEYKKTERGKKLASDENAEYFAMSEFD